MTGKATSKTAAKNTDKKTKAAEEEIEEEDLDDTELEDEDDESEDDSKGTGKKEPKPENNSEGYWMRQAKKLEKENAELKAQKVKDDKELAAERKKLESRAEVEKYDSVLEKLEDAGLPAKMRHLIDLDWDDERIDKAIDLLREQAEELAEAKSKGKDTKSRRRQDVDDDDDTDDDEEEEAPRKQQRRTRQAGEDRPERRSDKKLRDLSSITDPAKRIEEAAKDI